MHKPVLLFCIVALAVFALSCSKGDDEVAARFGEDVITVGMLKDQYVAMSPEARPDLGAIEAKEAFVRDVVSKEILLAEARKIGLDRMPEIIEASQSAARRVAWQAMYEDLVKSRVTVNDDEIRDLYAKHGQTYHLSWIFVRSGALAQDLSARIKRGEDFARLASVYSIDPSKTQGGDIGSRALGTMPASVEDLIMGMAPGEVSDPIPYDTYYVLVRLHDKQPIDQQPFEAARASLTTFIRSRKENALQREVVAGFREKHGLTFNDDTLELIARRTKALYPSENVEAGKIPSFSVEEMDRVVARYDDVDWYVKSYVERIKGQNAIMRPAYGVDVETIKSVITDFISGELWMMEIPSQGYNERPQVVAAHDRALEEATITAMHDHLIKDVAVDEEKLRQFYAEHQEEMVTDPGARIALVVSNAMEDAQDIFRELNAGADFAAMARERSIDRFSGENGGEISRPLAQRTLEQYPDLVEALDNLKVGAYTNPMEVPPGFGPDGFMIVKLLERIEASKLSFDQVKEMLQQRVLQMEQDGAFSQWLMGKIEEYQVEIYPAALGYIDFNRLRMQGT